MKRSGILLPIFSLPSPYGIGNFGKTAYQFVDFLAATGQSIWQILPLSQTSFGDSPYQSPSAFAGNPYFIDPLTLKEKGYVSSHDLAMLEADGDRVDYGRIYAERYPFLRHAYAGFLRDVPKGYRKFCEKEASWLDDYALFMAIKEDLRVGSFLNWDASTVRRENLGALREKYSYQIGFWKFLQYEFEVEWQALHTYANRHGVRIMGDLPIYVALDSADVWGNPEEFLLDRDLRPTMVAGVPPDAFSETGQLWGNPLYRWDRMREGGYVWWKRRFARAKSLYDMIRIDHFVGFSNYYAIPAGQDSALCGEIRRGVGAPFFEEVERSLGKLDIVAEDLGMLQDGVPELLAATGFPNMRVILFSFEGSDNPHAPEHHAENCVVYTGTHDNETARSFWNHLSGETKRRYNRKMPKGYRDPADRLIATAMASVADTVVIPMQDYLRLGDEGRMNSPSTAEGNWSWRLSKGYDRTSLRQRILSLSGKRAKRACR